MKALFKNLKEYLEESIKSTEELMRISKDNVDSHSYGVLQGKIDMSKEILYLLKHNLI